MKDALYTAYQVRLSSSMQLSSILFEQKLQDLPN
jgi:hypothetical protein